VQAQTQLNDPTQGSPTGATVVNNEIAVSRISSRSARLGLSVGLGDTERFEISTAAQVRQRPDITLATGDPTKGITVKAAEAAELSLQAVDRRSFAGLRLGLFGLRSFSIGDANLARTQVLIVRASAAHEIADGQGEWEADLGYVASKDDSVGGTCDPNTFTSCWGTSEASTISLAGFGMYRLAASWLGVASLELASQHLKTTDTMKTIDQPSILMVTAMLRLSYRF